VHKSREVQQYLVKAKFTPASSHPRRVPGAANAIRGVCLSSYMLAGSQPSCLSDKDAGPVFLFIIYRYIYRRALPGRLYLCYVCMYYYYVL